MKKPLENVWSSKEKDKNLKVNLIVNRFKLSELFSNHTIARRVFLIHSYLHIKSTRELQSMISASSSKHAEY